MRAMAELKDHQELSLKVNGEMRTVRALNVADLLAELGIPLAKVAVERNREIVPKSTFAETALAAGDEIEIVNFVGGG